MKNQKLLDFMAQCLGAFLGVLVVGACLVLGQSRPALAQFSPPTPEFSSVTVNTNGVVVSPTNFPTANHIAATNATNGWSALQSFNDGWSSAGGIGLSADGNVLNVGSYSINANSGTPVIDFPLGDFETSVEIASTWLIDSSGAGYAAGLWQVNSDGSTIFAGNLASVDGSGNINGQEVNASNLVAGIAAIGSSTVIDEFGFVGAVEDNSSYWSLNTGGFGDASFANGSFGIDSSGNVACQNVTGANIVSLGGGMTAPAYMDTAGSNLIDNSDINYPGISMNFFNSSSGNPVMSWPNGTIMYFGAPAGDNNMNLPSPLGTSFVPSASTDLASQGQGELSWDGAGNLYLYDGTQWEKFTGVLSW